MIRIALISDQHFDASSRFEECVRVHDWIAEDVARRKVDLVCLGGDLFERKSVPDDRNAAAEWLMALARSAPVVGVRGNHEVDGDLDLFNHLEASHAIVFFDRPTLHTIRCVHVACLPWPRRSALLAAHPEASHDQANQFAADHLRDVLRGLGAEAKSRRAPCVFLGHVMLRGAHVSTGQPVAPGCDFEIGTEDLALVGADAYLLGHIHMAQSFDVRGAPCIYPGSPRRTAFGETEQKSYAIVEIDEANGNRAVRWELVETPARQMLMIDAEWSTGSLSITSKHVIPGAEIRLRYRVTSDQRDAGRRAAQELRDLWLSDGAHSVKVEEEVVASTRARSPEIAAARTLPEKIQAYWTAKTKTPEPAVKERLLRRLSDLESEAAS